MAVESNRGLVKFIPPSELDRMEEDRILAERPESEPLSGLVQHVRDFLSSAKTAKVDIETKMLATLRRINGEYEADKLAAIKSVGMPEDFIRLTYHKCRDAESWITEVLSSLGLDRTWDIEIDGPVKMPPQEEAAMMAEIRQALIHQAIANAQATGQPIDAEAVITQSKELEEQVKQEAVKRARAVAEERATNMEILILSQLETGGWWKAFKAVINDLTRFKACIMKGPVYRKKQVLKWSETGQAIVGSEIVAEFERVNPFDWFPAANSIDVDDGPSIEMEHFTRKDLAKLIGVPGYKEDAIRAILAKHGNGFKENAAIDAERFVVEKGSATGQMDNITGKIDSINYWGDVPGKMLLEFGMSPKDIPDPDLDYQVNVKIVDDICYKAVLNPDLLGKKPYHVTSFIKSNDSQWGESPGDLMEDIQNEANQAVRGLVYNVAVSSGPITQVNIDMLADGETSDVYPGKTFETISKNMTTRAIDFYQADMRVRELLSLVAWCKSEADDLVVPSFSANDARGADKTAAGRSMRITAAARNIKLAIENVDGDIVVKAITMLFNNNMRFLDDPSIKGALKVKARGASKQIVKEQLAVRRQEFANMLSPEDKQIMGVKGMAYALRERAKSVEFDPDMVIPGYEEIERGVASPLQPPAQQMGQAA